MNFPIFCFKMRIGAAVRHSFPLFVIYCNIALSTNFPFLA